MATAMLIDDVTTGAAAPVPYGAGPSSSAPPTKPVDLYVTLKGLQDQMEFLAIQEAYIKDEQKNLKRELLRAEEEVKRIQSVPLVIGQFLEMVDESSGIVHSTTGQTYYARILRSLRGSFPPRPPLIVCRAARSTARR